MGQVRFLQFSVTDGTNKARVHYSLDNDWNHARCVRIFAKDYTSSLGAMFRGGVYENKTDLQSDYFDKGSVLLTESHPLYGAARSAALEAEWARRSKRRAKLAARRAS